MRIVIDMQGAQTASRFRGIGRYTLSFVQAVVRNKGEHEVILALNGLFPESIAPIQDAFKGLLPLKNIRVWSAPATVAEVDETNVSRLQTAEKIHETFLASLRPDVVHITSLFEGYREDAVISMGRLAQVIPMTVMLYDLIPLLNPDQYLTPNPSYARFYHRKLKSLKKSARYFAISEFSRQEGLVHLGVDENSIINVSTAIEANFKAVEVTQAESVALHEKLGIERQFVLYTGGADERKNLSRLIQAYANLPSNLREQHQLVFVGRMTDGIIAELRAVAKKNRLGLDELCFTGYITDEELVQLYNLAELFVFPSWHEGFGLPALEAMACGTPVIGANTSSLPEVINLEEALFDPLDVQAMSTKIAEVLSSSELRQKMRAHGFEQAKRFSWDYTAQRALTAWEEVYTSSVRSLALVDLNRLQQAKPKLAFVSPLPPEHTVIADYSAELLPALALYYDIYVIVEQEQISNPWIQANCKQHDAAWLYAHAHEMDRVLYQVGNSPFQAYMLPLIQVIPGTVVLHDFYLSGLMGWLEEVAGVEARWTHALYLSHGYLAVQHRFEDAQQAKAQYPVNFEVLRAAQGVIVHSNHSRQLAKQWYGQVIDANDWAEIPLEHAPESRAEQYTRFIEQFHQRSDFNTSALTQALAATLSSAVSDSELIELANHLATSMPQLQSAPCLYLDVTATYLDDLKTGIQRVARALVVALIQNPPANFRVEPVYLQQESSGQWLYRYAYNYTLELLQCPPQSSHFNGKVVGFQAGDVLLGLDLSGQMLIQAQQDGLFNRLRQQGVSSYFLLYDLLPVHLPEVFPPGSAEAHSQWLHAVASMDGAIGISQTVADDFTEWCAEMGLSQAHEASGYSIEWIHLGADLTNSAPSLGMPNDSQQVLEQLSQRPTFLMVSTIEPRKGYLQSLHAFTQLWEQGHDINLVLVGKEGWQGLPESNRRDIPQIMQTIKEHPELGRHLFHLEGISDEYLEKVYAASTCLIAASKGEGFGLPLIEAAQHQLPIIARDIPVFREVAAEHAFYFTGLAASDLAAAIQAWLSLYEQGQHPTSEAMPWLTWAESARQLAEHFIKEKGRSDV